MIEKIFHNKQLLFRLLLLLSFGSVAASIILGHYLDMPPCILCYLGRIWLCLFGVAVWCTRHKLHLWWVAFSVWFIAFVTNLYHVYLITWAPPKSSCVPWALLHMKKTFLSQISFIVSSRSK